MALPAWHITQVERGLFPAVALIPEGIELCYSDGSGPSNARYQQITVNTTLCPFDMARGICSPTTQSVELYLGLLAKTPELYQVLRKLVDYADMHDDGVFYSARGIAGQTGSGELVLKGSTIEVLQRALEILEEIEAPNAYAELKEDDDD